MTRKLSRIKRKKGGGIEYRKDVGDTRILKIFIPHVVTVRDYYF